MSPNRRIFLNIVATYGRSLYALVIGLFCGRWTLMALGQVDYGLVGLVGGLTAFVSFVNGLLSMSVGRFYAVAVGAARKCENPEVGIDDCRKWFNTALLIHTVVPLVLVIVGYPVGEWAVRHFLTIPPDRIEGCLWVWRFTCISCFVGMLNVPFNAMYTAKQEIAELTIYGFVTSTANFLVLFYMVTHPRIWMTWYSFAMMAISVSIQLLVGVRAVVRYPECKFVGKYLYDKKRICEIFSFAMARLWSALACLVCAQGRSILVNKYMGPVYNSSMTVGNTVASHAATLSSSLSGAFWPAIANKVGEGKENAARNFGFATCRIGALFMLIFAIPLALEIDEVMLLWLKNPPPAVSIICIAILVEGVSERLSEGLMLVIMAVGRRVGLYSGLVSVAGLIQLLLTYFTFACGYGIPGFCIVLVGSHAITTGVRLVLGRKLVGMSIRFWGQNIFMPVLLVSAVTCLTGLGVQLIVHEASVCRVILTTIVCECVFIPLAWKFVCTSKEREMLCEKGKHLLGKVWS